MNPSKERILELTFSSEYVPHLSITDSKVGWLLLAIFSLLQAKNSRRSASAINPVTTKTIDDSHLQTGSHALHYRVSKKKWTQKEDKGSP